MDCVATPQIERATCHTIPPGKGLPTQAIKKKADDFIAESMLTHEEARLSVETIENERGKERLMNDADPDAAADAPGDGRTKISDRLSRAEMEAELEKRIEMMRAGGGGDGVPDQIRVFEETFF